MNYNGLVGYTVTTFLLSIFNKRSKSNTETQAVASDLSVQDNASKLGNPIPVILGTRLLKSPLVSYFGDFRADLYTEEYSAHAKFDGKGMVLSLILAIIASAFTTVNVTPAIVQADGANEAGPVHSTGTAEGGTYKDIVTPAVLLALFQWLLGWLINGRNLKTTVQKGFKYYLGYQYLVCWTCENVTIKRMYLKEIKIYEGSLTKLDHLTGTTIQVNDENLFGGVDEDGGFVGNFNIYFGTAQQPKDSWMISQMSKSNIQVELSGLTPKYSPFLTMVVPTAYIGKSSSIPELWVEIENIPNRLGLGKIGIDANPAEIIYECHVNTDWGLNESPDLIDLDKLIEFGNRLKTEQLGLSILMDKTMSAEDIIDLILQHINGTKYVDNTTGKMVYMLIREDYNTNDLLTIDTSNAISCEFSRLSWNETVSSISVNFTDAENLYEVSTIPYHDLANMMINNTKTTKSYDFTWFTNPANALIGAKRESFAQGYPIATVSIEMNRKGYDLHIGKPFILNWKPYGITKALYRITNYKYSDFVNGTILIEAVEDVFSLGKTVFDYNNGGEWEEPITYPTGVNRFNYFELPYEMSYSKNSFIYALANRPDYDTQLWHIYTLVNGTYQRTNSMTKWTPTGELVYSYLEDGEYVDVEGFEIKETGLSDDIDTVFRLIQAGTNNNRNSSNVLMIDNEIMSFNNLVHLPNGNWKVTGVIRGIFDTIPQNHSFHTSVYFLLNGHIANISGNSYLAFQGQTNTTNVNIQTASVDNTEEFDFNKVRTVSTDRRAERPSPVGNFKMGRNKGSYSTLERFPTNSIMGGDLQFTYLPRDKFNNIGVISQIDTNHFISGLPITEPVGTTYILEVEVNGAVVQKEYQPNILNKLEYKWATRCLDFPNTLSRGTVLKLYSKCNNLLSYNYHTRVIDWKVPILTTIGVEGSAELSSVMNTQGMNTQGMNETYIIPSGSYNQQYVVSTDEAPIILYGIQTVSTTIGAIMRGDGTYWLPNGKASLYCGKIANDNHKLFNFNLEIGYTIKSYFDSVSQNRYFYYRWDGLKFNQVNVTE